MKSLLEVAPCVAANNNNNNNDDNTAKFAGGLDVIK